MSSSVRLFLLISFSLVWSRVGFGLGPFHPGLVPSTPEGRAVPAGFFVNNPGQDLVKVLGAADYGGFSLSPDGEAAAGYSIQRGVCEYNTAFWQPRWCLATDAAPTISPVVLKDRIIVGVRSGEVMEIDRASQKVVWRQGCDGYAIQPLVVTDERVFVVTATQSVYSINRETGKVAWVQSQDATELDDRLPIRSQVAPVLSGSTITIGFNTGEVVGYDQETGKVVAHHELPASLGGIFQDVILTAEVGGDIVVARSDGFVGRKKLSGDLRWKAEVPQAIGAVVTDGGDIVVATSRGVVHAIDGDTGKTQWTADLAQAISYIAMDGRSNNRIVVVSASGRVELLNAETGQALWRAEIGSAVLAKPFTLGERLFITTSLATYSFL